MNGSARPRAAATVQIGDYKQDLTVKAADHVEAVHHGLAQLTDPAHGCLRDASEVSAIALKTVHGGRYSGVQRVTPDVLAAMEEMCGVAPAHNPPYIAAMRLLADKLPQIPLVAAFETDFHATIPPCNQLYAIPYEWSESGCVRRWGFHGASHRYIAGRTAELLGRSGPADHLLPPGRFQFAVCHSQWPERGHEHGHEPAEWSAAE